VADAITKALSAVRAVHRPTHDRPESQHLYGVMSGEEEDG
jgi:hypothetical protein